MSRSGDEMMAELSRLMNTSVVKTAEKKVKEDEKEDKEEVKEEKKEEKEEVKDEKKEDKKEDKKKKKEKSKKKDAATLAAINDLVKLASDLDDIGADEASSLVDDALRIIVKNVKSAAISSEIAAFEEDEPSIEPERRMPPRHDKPMRDEPEYGEVADVAQMEVDEEEGVGEDEAQFMKAKSHLMENLSPDKMESFLKWIETGRK